MQKKTTRAAIIGTGSIAEAHMEALRNQDNRVRVLAANDVVPDRLQAFCDKHEIPGWYVSVAELPLAGAPWDVSMATARFASGTLGSVLNTVLGSHEQTHLHFDFQRATVEVS